MGDCQLAEQTRVEGCEREINHPQKAGFVDFATLMLIALLLVVPFVILALREFLKDIYSRIVQYYERSIDEACFLSFRTRATEARVLDADVGYRLQLAKRAVDKVRADSPDQSGLQIALFRISDLLSSAAETSDRALRSLEDGHTRMGTSNLEIFTREDVDM
jgi:hypothetical protein